MTLGTMVPKLPIHKMKAITLIIALSTLGIAAQEIERNSWQWQQRIPTIKRGLTRIELSPETLNTCQANLDDLRLLSPDGIETPYLLDGESDTRPREHAITNFKVRMLQGSTILEANTDTHDPIEAVTIITPAPIFLKSLRLEGALPEGDWQTIASNEMIFRQDDGAARLRIPLPPKSWSRLRFSIDDSRSKPIPFTDLRVTIAATRPELRKHPLVLGTREEVKHRTLLSLNLGHANLDLAELHLKIDDPVFSRHYTLSSIVPSSRESGIRRKLGSGSIFRVLGENGAISEQVSIPIKARLATASLILEIDNANSPPLSISSVSSSRVPTRLLFFATSAGEWTLLSGNRQASKPHYGLSQLRKQLKLSRVTEVSSTQLMAAPNYQAPPALPEIQAKGAAIDLKNWVWRCPIDAPSSGVIRIIPSPLALSHSQADLADLRVIQDEMQVPFLIRHTGSQHAIEAKISNEPDSKRPHISRWKLTLPFAGLPAHELLASSSSPLFSRSFQALVDDHDRFCNPRRRVIGSGNWTKAAIGPNGPNTQLAIRLDRQHLPRSFYLETDNGDNPAISLDQVTLYVSKRALVLKRSDSAPLDLYYGNPSAVAPNYDLSLVRRDLLAAPLQASTLGEPEQRGPNASDRHSLSTGSPWLWLALALIVAVLLGIVAKLLPRQ